MSDETGADDAPAEKRPVRNPLDLCVFAPVRAAVSIMEDLPGLIDKSRGRVEQEISNARVAGQYAVGRFQRRLAARLDSLRHSDDGAPVPETPRDPVPTAPAPSPSFVRSVPDAADAATLGAALADYDTLSASQVVRRLEGLGPDELRAVQRYESATRHRRTILNRANQLLEEGPTPAPPG